MLLIVILNVFFVWVLPVTSTYNKTFVPIVKISLNDGNCMSQPSFGTFVPTNQIDKLREAVSSALEVGYRSIDTWDLYEDIVGEAVRDAISCGSVKRQDLFITVKLPLVVYKGEQVVPAIKQLLKILQLDYVDMVIFTPINTFNRDTYDIVDIWRGLEKARKLSLTRSIGVRYFDEKYFNQLLAHCTTVPAVNQIEVNPSFTNAQLVDYCLKKGINVMAYAPAGYTVPRPGVKDPPPSCLTDPVVVKIAKKYGVSTSQVVLRYAIDRGTVPIPRSVSKKNIKSNNDILDFSLTANEVQKISNFNKDRPVYCIDANFLSTMYKERLEFALKRNKKLYEQFSLKVTLDLKVF